MDTLEGISDLIYGLDQIELTLMDSGIDELLLESYRLIIHEVIGKLSKTGA